MSSPNIACQCGDLIGEGMPTVAADDNGDLWHRDHRVVEEVRCYAPLDGVPSSCGRPENHGGECSGAWSYV